MKQTWNRLLFAHWAIPESALRPLVPPELPIDTFAGQAWVGITPFLLSGLRPHCLPPIPGASRFPELNVRTYTKLEDKPGVYFFSLDAGSKAAVLGARLAYGLPYFFADASFHTGDSVHYRSRRTAQPARFEARYRPVGKPVIRPPGELEHWLVERYCLYNVERGRVYRAEIHHLPWPLQEAEAEITENSMAAAAGVQLPATKPLLHYAEQLHVLVWFPQRVHLRS